MRNPAIVVGEPRTVLQLGPVALRADAGWTQDNSDTLAHFIQVHKQVAMSSWLKQECTFGSAGGKISGKFPNLESFVYVAVYFRQLFSERDHLFVDACDCYTRSVDSQVKAAWVNGERHRCLSSWCSPGMFIKDYSTKDVFHAFLYGAYLLHSIPGTWKKHKDAFRDILSNVEPNRMLFELHGSLRTMLDYVSHVSAVVYQDFAHWLNNGDAPLPDVMWQESVFKSETGS